MRFGRGGSGSGAVTTRFGLRFLRFSWPVARRTARLYALSYSRPHSCHEKSSSMQRFTAARHSVAFL